MSTTPLTPAAQWDTMTDGEKISWIAVEVMGWEKWETDRIGHGKAWCWMKSGRKTRAWDHADAYWSWNPLSDWNHWRQVSEEIGFKPENNILAVEFRRVLVSMVGDDVIGGMLNADLPTRARALYLAFSSLHG